MKKSLQICCKEWTGFIKFNVVVAIAEVNYDEHLGLWQIAEDAIWDFLIERFSCYQLI